MSDLLSSRRPCRDDAEMAPAFERPNFNLSCDYFSDFELERGLFIGALWLVTYVVIVLHALTMSYRQASDSFFARQPQLLFGLPPERVN